MLAGYDAAAQTATYTVTVNPLVNWIWFGFGVMALGTGIALLPESAFAFAAAQVPAGAAGATTSLLILCCCCRQPCTRSTSRRSRPNDAVARTPLEKESCAPRDHLHVRHVRTQADRRVLLRHAAEDARSWTPSFATGQDARGDLRSFVDRSTAARSRSAAPIDKGFNRLAWLFPYLVGASGAVAVAFVAMRWSRREHEPGRGRRSGRRRCDAALAGWTMSSATSTSAGAECPASAGRRELADARPSAPRTSSSSRRCWRRRPPS